MRIKAARKTVIVDEYQHDEPAFPNFHDPPTPTHVAYVVRTLRLTNEMVLNAPVVALEKILEATRDPAAREGLGTLIR